MTLQKQEAVKNKVLIIEDELVVANFCAIALREAGMSSIIVQDFSAIENECRAFQPDLILLDFHIPNLDTVDLIRKMREKLDFVATPIVMMSTNDNPDNILRAYESGADDFIEKPIHPDYLISVVNSRIKRMRNLKDLFGQTSSSIAKPTQKINVDELKAEELKAQELPDSPTSILDDILCKLLLDFKLLSIQEIKVLLRKQRELEHDDYIMHLHDILQHLKTIDSQILENILLLKDPEGQSLIEGYTADKVIAKGGMGVIYSGYEEATQKHVAIKVFYDKENSQSIDLQRFERECNLAKALDHPGITKAYEFGKFNDMYYIVMEFVAGQTLTEIVREKGPFSEKEALEIFRQTLDAMTFAWERNIIHRDLKPDNIMLTSSKEVKICDLGLAKATNSDSQLTQDNVILGTPYYMSPEQCMGKQLDYRTDVYSLGVTLYAMLTGRVPFQGNFLEVAQGHMTDSPPSPQVYGVNLSQHLHDFLYQLMHKIPQDRCGDVKVLRRDFHDVQLGRKPYSLRKQSTKKMIRRQLRYMLIILVVVVIGFSSFWGYKKFQQLQTSSNIKVLFASKEYQTAAKLSASYLQEHSSDFSIHKICALSYLKLDKYNKAYDYFLNIIEPLAQDEEVVEGYAYAVYHAKSKKEALEQINECVMVKERPLLLYLKARLHWQLKQQQQAVKALTKTIALDANYWRAHYLLMVIEGNLKHIDKLVPFIAKQDQAMQQWLYYSCAAKLFQMQKYDRAAKLFTLAQKLSERQQIYQYLGVVYYQNKNFKKAIEYLLNNGEVLAKPQRKYDLDVGKNLHLPKSDIYFYIAKAHYELKEIQKATVFIDKSLELTKDDFRYFDVKLSLLQQQKKYREAIQILDFVIVRFPQQKNAALFKKAQCLTLINKWQDSLKILNEIIKTSSEHQAVFALQIEVLVHLEQYQRALDKINDYTKLYSNDLDIFVLSGKIHEKQGDLEAAIKEYQKATGNVVANTRLVLIFYRMQKYLRMISTVNKIFATKLPVTKVRHILLFYRGLGYFHLERFQGSAADLLQALQMKKLDATSRHLAYYYLGVISFKEKQYKQARQYFIVALKGLSDQKKRKSIRFYLQEIKKSK